MVSPTPPSTTFIFLVMLILGLLTPFGECDRSDLRVSQCLKVSSSEFVNSVRATIGVLQQVTSILSQFSNGFGDFRLCNAVNDCLDLLDLSFDDLNWSASATESPEGKHNSTGNLSSDLRTWLSAALANPETCMAGFEGTNSIVKGLVSAGLNQVVSLVRQLLNQVEFHPSPNPNHYHKGRGQFPSWIKPWDQKLLQATGFAVDAVVAADGTGNFTRVTDAVEAAPDYSMRRYVIHIKRGVYIENVVIKKKKWNLMMIGDGMAATVISGNRSYVDGWTTFRSATFGVSGRGFIARDITFQNTAGPQKHQAVALRSDSDLSVFYRCGIFGYQDSLYTHTMRQFFRECTIKGTVDFIFGDATVVFQSCQILARKGLPSQKNTITAQGRKDPNEPTGFSIQFCNISADSDLVPFANSTETYLGRPWKTYSRTVFMQSYMSEVVRPRGWLEWDGNLWLDTLYYAEFMNRGPGAGMANRVKWAGFHVLNDSSQARNYTVARFIDGDYWLPSTGVRYTDGLGA